MTGNKLSRFVPPPSPDKLESSGFAVTKKAKRPFSETETCFYCGAAIGAEHRHDCVLVMKKVTVRAIVEYEVQVPADWDEHLILFQRNDGSWCGSNMIGELEELDERDGCLCQHIKWELVEDSDEAFLDEG